ncbi:monofunctional biosynthetic peptidoglycan transglycosylase [Spirosomataceae bacterium TFI 002]|nr:monofunctional biosynthetic peptidoglycan transglycosylase [Spirosomataceae bacterium TFI 002]
MFLKIKRIIYKSILWFFILSIGGVILFKFIPIPFTMTMIGSKLNVEKSYDQFYRWTAIENISKEAQLAVIASEDQLFFEHNGFDIKGIKNAIEKNKKGKKLRGGSTISQQVARNVFLWQKRSWFRKGLEAYFTLLIELVWGKERILEVYLNIAELGPNTFGMKAAAHNFFKKDASKLTRQEAARLAACLPSPRRYSAVNPGGYVQKRTSQIVRQMRALGGTSYLKF